MRPIDADALMLAIRIFTVSALVVMGVIAVVEGAYEKARTKKDKEVDSDDD